jgi:hypothetical protein
VLWTEYCRQGTLLILQENRCHIKMCFKAMLVNRYGSEPSGKDGTVQ